MRVGPLAEETGTDASEVRCRLRALHNTGRPAFEGMEESGVVPSGC